jgi:hypothetical protein
MVFLTMGVAPENGTHGSGDIGHVCLGVRNDTGDGLGVQNMQYGTLQLNRHGCLRVSSAPCVATTWRSESVTGTAAVAAASAVTLQTLAVTNGADGSRHLWIYDMASGASSADPTVFDMVIPAFTTIVYTSLGMNMVNGISVRSTTGSTMANNAGASTNDVRVMIVYV